MSQGSNSLESRAREPRATVGLSSRSAKSLDFGPRRVGAPGERVPCTGVAGVVSCNPQRLVLTRCGRPRYSRMRLIVLSASTNDHTGCFVRSGLIVRIRRRQAADVSFCIGCVSTRHARVQGSGRRANTGIGREASPGVQSDMSHGSQTWLMPWPTLGIRFIEKQMENA